MIQYLTLERVAAQPYRSRRGGAVRLRFEGPHVVYVHHATVQDLEDWEGRIGEQIPVSLRWREYEGLNYANHQVIGEQGFGSEHPIRLEAKEKSR